MQPSEADLSRLLQAVRGDAFEALVWIGLGAGLRRGEVAALRWEDLEYLADDIAVIRAHRRVNRLGNGIGRLERDGLKSAAERRVHIGGATIEVLHGRWKHQLAERLEAGASWRGPEYVANTPTGCIFTTAATGTPIAVDKIDDYFMSVRKRAGLDIRVFHGLRRAFTTLLDRSGVSDRVVMDMAGHKHLDMTHYYQHPMETQKRAAAGALDATLRQLSAGA